MAGRRKRKTPRMQILKSSSSLERTEGTPSTLPQTAQSSSSSTQRPQVPDNQEAIDFLRSIGEEGADLLLPTQRASTRLSSPQPRQTPSSSQATGSIVTGRPSDDRLGTRTVAAPQAPPPPLCQVCECRSEKKRMSRVGLCQGCYSFYRNLMETKPVLSCITGRNECTNFTGFKSCRSCRYQKCIAVGMPPIAFNKPKPATSSDCLIEVFGYAKGILSDENIQEPQMRQILRTQWPMLLVLASFQQESVAHEFHKQFERKFQRFQLSGLEISYLIMIALFMEPREPCEFNFQRKLDDKIVELRTHCHHKKKPAARCGNLLLWLSDIKYLAPDTPLDISEAELETIIDNTFIQ